jgi:hypothetical protein
MTCSPLFGGSNNKVAVTSFDFMTKIPFYTVDSTTWLVGTQFGELNFFDGRKMKRLKKAVWKTQYRNKLIELGANWNLAEREEPYELIRINVLTFLQVEKYVRSLMKNKMYWIKDGFKKMDKIEMPKRTEKDMIPADALPQYEWFDGDKEDWEDYCFELGIDVNLGQEEAVNILLHYVNFISFNREALDKYTDDAIFYFVDLFGLKEVCNTRKKAMEVLPQYFNDNARGARHDFEHASENTGDVRVKPKEREEYIEEEAVTTVEIDKKTVESVLSQFIPENSEMPEVEEYDRILASQGIVAVRDEKGRLLKGQQLVRKKKNIYPESMYKLSCDTCIKSMSCPDYQEGYVCAYNKMFKRFNTRDMRDIQDAMHSIAEMSLERLQRAMMFEMLDGGVLDPTVSGLMGESVKYMQMIQQMDNLGKQLVAQQRVVVDAQGNSETVTTVSANPQQGGVLAKLFGGMGDSKKGEEKEVIDITPVKEDEGD